MLLTRRIKFSKLIKSHVIGDRKLPLIEHSISKQLEIAANRFSDQLAIISNHQSKQLTFAQLYESARRVAGNLLASGVKKGDRVGIYSSNSAEWAIIQMACALADTIFVTINPAYRVEDLKHCLNLTELNVLVASNWTSPVRMLDNVDQLLEGHASTYDFRDLKLDNLPHLRKIFVINNQADATKTFDYPDFETNLLRADFPKIYNTEIDRTINKQNPHEGTNIQFTSGTTGLPKGALLTHHNILNNAFLIGRQMGYSPADKICLSVPLYHCFGMVMGNLAGLVHGATVIYPNATFKATAVLESVQKYHGTTVYGVPTMFIEMCKLAETGQYDLSSLSKGVIAGSLCPEILLKRVGEKMNVKYFSVAYGMTETSPITFMTRPNDTTEQQTQTVGKILPHTEAKLVDDHGHVVEIGKKGEYITRGYAVMKGYYNNPKETHRSIKDGWMHSGDIGIMDEDGFLRIVGRIKDIIIRGGENIAPKEIEEVILHMDNVENVQVIGVEDEKLGEEICALIKLKHPEIPFDIKSVAAFLKPKLAHYKVPKYVRVVDHMPITVTGKPQKFKMRQEWKHHIEEIGSAERYRIR